MSKARVVAEFVAVRWFRRLSTRRAVERRQRRLLRRQLAFLRRNSPYFAELIPPGARSLDALPHMDKATMMANFDRMNTVGVSRDHAMALALSQERSRDFAGGMGTNSVGLSSGTSGHRGIFVVSRAERESWAGTVLARTLPRGHLFGHRIALFLRADNTLYEAVASRAVSFEYFDVHADAEENIARLERYGPTILVAPPSVLAGIARAAAEGVFTRMPQKVYSVAEVLEEADAARIRSGLRQRLIHQIYQCTEGFLAHSCEHGVIHLNEDSVLFEREELGQGRFTPIITDLRRRAQPIVRYRLGDVLSIRPEPCPCGSALTAISRIEGRAGDTLVLPSARDGSVRIAVYADLVSRAMIHAEGFEEYRVTQVGPLLWRVELDDLSADTRGSVAGELLALAGRVGAQAPELRFERYEFDGGQKLRRVQRQWGDADEKV